MSAPVFIPANPLADSDPPVPPLDPRTLVLEAGSVHHEGARPLDTAILLEQDAAVTLRDGTVLRADVYRPTDEEPVPAIVVYTPYGKRGGWWNEHFYATRFGVPADALSGLQAVEAPDPGFWCRHGYAIVVVDAAGTGRSGGDAVFMGSRSGRNAADVVDWAGEQPWCTGRVGMAGNSQLGMIQWATAAEHPRHLAAIAPWEGASDVYRDALVRGGIPDTEFNDHGVAAMIFGEHGVEDTSSAGANLREHPLVDAYWDDKVADLSRVDVPAYVLASWTNPLHTRGTLAAYRALPSETTWLRVHHEQEWIDFADPRRLHDLRRFFDRYLKGVENDWEATPRVRLSVLDLSGHGDVVDRPERSWPLERMRTRELHLDAASGELRDAVAEPASVTYAGDDLTAGLRFSLVLDADVEINGPLVLRLTMAAEDADDLDLFASVHLESADGARLHHITLRDPKARAGVRSMAVDGRLPGMLAYTGPVGRIRASHRRLDPSRSTPLEPYLAHDAEERLVPGEPVELQLALWPTAMLAHAGERLVVELAGHPVGPLSGDNHPGGWLEVPTRNVGRHRLLTGEGHDSVLLLPIVD